MPVKLCEAFQERETDTAHASVILLDEPMLQSLISVYSLMPAPEIRVESRSELMAAIDDPDSVPLERSWDLIWSCTIVDWMELRARAGIDTTARTRALFKRLIAAWLVYPDGTISETAKDILNARTIREIERTTGGRKGGGGES